MEATGKSIRVVLELEASSDPIRGSVLTEQGARSFDGWMQLTASLEDVRAGARATVAHDGDRTDHGAEAPG